MKKQLFIYALTLMGLAGCANDPVSRTPTNNYKVPVDLLFEHDGIKVYRFRDDGRYHYFTKNSCTTIQSCGKNCTYEETITTNP